MAARFWIGGGTNSNWNSSPITNWCDTSGGVVPVAAPTSSDDVTFDGAGISGNSASTMSAVITVLSVTFTSGYTNTVTVNTTLTVAGNFTDNTAHSWAGTGSLQISAASTITSGGKIWPNSVFFSVGGVTRTLSGDWTIGGFLQTNNNATNTLNSGTLTCVGINASGNASCILTGTTEIIVTGGTLVAAAGGSIRSNLTIAGNVTIGSVLAYNTGTLTYSSGTVTTTGSTVTIGVANTTLNTNGISWNNITIGSSITLTLNSLLTVTGTFLVNVALNTTFAGSAGFTVGTFTCSAIIANVQTLVNGVTYTITTAFNCFLSKQSTQVLFTSDHASIRAILILQNSSTTCNVLAAFTRISADGGRPIVTFNGTITDCLNVVQQSNVLYNPVTSFNRGIRRLSLTNKNKATLYQ